MTRGINSRFAGGVLLFLVAGLLAGVGGGLIARPSRGVLSAGRKAYQTTLEFSSSASPSFTVPPGKRLALMYVAATMSVATGQQPLLSIKTVAGGNIAEYPLVMTRQVTNLNGFDTYCSSQSLAGLYADGGTEVVFNGSTTSTKSFNGKISVSASLIE